MKELKSSTDGYNGKKITIDLMDMMLNGTDSPNSWITINSSKNTMHYLNKEKNLLMLN
jgi:hypothetical protein